MKQSVLSLTRVFTVISIIVLVFAFSAYAEEGTTDNSVNISHSEEIIDSIGTELANKGLADESVTLFAGILPFDAETVTIMTDSGVVHKINAATPLGRLAIAALEGEGFEYLVNDERFESDGILTLVSIESYVNGETGTWKAYEEMYGVSRRITDDEVSTLLIADAVIFVYSKENDRGIAFVEILAEPLIDEINTEASSDAEVTPEPSAELDEQ